MLYPVSLSPSFLEGGCIDVVQLNNKTNLWENDATKKKGIVRKSISKHLCNAFNPLIANPTKWSNTVKQFVGKLPTNCLRVFDHFEKLAPKVLSELHLLKIARVKYAVSSFELNLVKLQEITNYGKSPISSF